jgi:hypothetical protein
MLLTFIALLFIQQLAAEGPCDIFAAGGTPCVAAHSTVRALYASYDGPLYQVRRTKDNAVTDIKTQSAGGYVNAADQDTFCANTDCFIATIYDQSPKGNHLKPAPPGRWPPGDLEADATKAKITIKGHQAYGVYTTGGFTPNPGVGYRNDTTSGVATGDEPEGIYMVADGKHYNQWCCFDYGNAETNAFDDGDATMEAVYFGSSTQWGHGSGSGPWVLADLENGLFGGGELVNPSNTPIDANYVTGLVKGNSGNYYKIKGGSAQSGTLKTMYEGTRPKGYSPMKKQGAIILGTGGDNSHGAVGTFFEGAITSGYPSDATDDAVQANIISAGYGM